jgi:hypothetical protein
LVSTRGSGPKAAAAIWKAAKILLVFGGAGPLVGLVVFAAGISAVTMAGGQPGGVWLGPFILLYGILFAHFVGLPWAALAAAVAIGLSHFAGARAWIGAASGGASFAVAAAAGFVQVPPGSDSAAGAAVDTFGVTFASLMAAVHVLSALVCWLIVRPLIRD